MVRMFGGCNANSLGSLCKRMVLNWFDKKFTSSHSTIEKWKHILLEDLCNKLVFVRKIKKTAS